MSEPRTHDLKVWPEYFFEILDGRKRFEVRKDDRHFCEGDRVALREWDPAKCRSSGQSGAARKIEDAYTGRKVHANILYVMRGGQFGLPSEMCVFGFELESDNGARAVE